MPVCTIPLAKAAIETYLLAETANPDSAIAGIPISWAWPGAKAAREFFFFGTTHLQENWRSVGAAGDKQEDYTIEAWFLVHQQGDDAKTAELRMWDMAAVLETVLRSNKDLGLGPPDVLTLTVAFAGAQQDTFIELEGRTAQVRCDVSVKTRI